MDVFDAIRSRRSVHNFKDNEIPHTVISRIMEVVRWAPSAGNIHHTRAVIANDSKIKKEIANACSDQEWVRDAPVIIAICSDTNKVTKVFGDQGKIYALQSTATTTQNIMLSAEELGLGSCWIGAFSDARVRKSLRIPQNIEIHNLIALGYPARTPRVPSKPPTHNIIKFNSWVSMIKNQKDFPIFWESGGQKLMKKLSKSKKK